MTGTTRFRAGLIGGLIGSLLWGSTFLFEVVTSTDNTPVAVTYTLGFFLMLGFPLLFWLLIPGFFAVRTLWRRLATRK